MSESPRVTRRSFLRGAGAMTVVVAGGGVWRAWDQGVWNVGQGPAYEPWTTWRTDPTEGPVGLVRAAILASNPHNTQPWLFRIEENRIDVFADLDRHLGSFDPYRREMFLGLGCALENLVLAARAHGYDPDLALEAGTLDPPPAGEGIAPVVRVQLRPGGNLSEQDAALHAAIPHRHTNRGPYRPDAPLSVEEAEGLEGVGHDEEGTGLHLVVEPDARKRLGALIIEATERIVADPEMVHDSERWFRHTRQELERHRDGPTLDAAGLPPLQAALAKLLPRPSPERNHAYWLAQTREVHVATAPVFGLVTVPRLYDRALTLRAGRRWQRMQLWATTRGLVMQPLNQPVEIVDRWRSTGRTSPLAEALAPFIGGPGREPTFVFRVGRPQRGAGPSPRRPVSDVLHG